jgi:ribonuclease HI
VFPDKIVCTEASSFACAGFTVETYTRVVHKMWSSEEALKSSTYRELKAVLLALFSLQEVFQNRLVNIYTDNQNVVRITNTGSMKSELQSLAIDNL